LLVYNNKRMYILQIIFGELERPGEQ